MSLQTELSTELHETKNQGRIQHVRGRLGR